MSSLHRATRSYTKWWLRTGSSRKIFRLFSAISHTANIDYVRHWRRHLIALLIKQDCLSGCPAVDASNLVFSVPGVGINRHPCPRFADSIAEFGVVAWRRRG